VSFGKRKILEWWSSDEGIVCRDWKRQLVVPALAFEHVGRLQDGLGGRIGRKGRRRMRKNTPIMDADFPVHPRIQAGLEAIAKRQM
jgi:hypothetical protein